jgi:hypothetical protein
MILFSIVKICKCEQGNFTKLYLFLPFLTPIFFLLWDSELTAETTPDLPEITNHAAR